MPLASVVVPLRRPLVWYDTWTNGMGSLVLPSMTQPAFCAKHVAEQRISKAMTTNDGIFRRLSCIVMSVVFSKMMPFLWLVQLFCGNYRVGAIVRSLSVQSSKVLKVFSSGTTLGISFIDLSIYIGCGWIIVI